MTPTRTDTHRHVWVPTRRLSPKAHEGARDGNESLPSGASASSSRHNDANKLGEGGVGLVGARDRHRGMLRRLLPTSWERGGRCRPWVEVGHASGTGCAL